MKIIPLLLSTSILFAQGPLRVEKARFRPFEIAVLGQAELADIVLNDLELSGVFKNSMAAISEGRVQIQSQPTKTTVSVNQKTFTYQEPVSRKLGHQIANDVYQFFTGEPGIFFSKIVASKITPQGKQIVLLDFDGQNEKQITQASNIHILPILHPSGKEILFTSYLNKNPDLFSIKTDGTGLKTISNQKGLNSGVSFGRNGKLALTLSFEGKSDIYLTDIAGNHRTRLTSGYGINSSASFSPDGSQIAFVSNRSGNPQIYVMQTDGKNPKRITFQGKYNQSPKWSPRGNAIVFTGRDEQNVFDLFLIDLKTKKISRITQDQGNNEEAAFSPNGRMIVFSSTRNGSRDLFVSNLDGSFQKQITHQGQYWTPYWGN